MYSNVPRDLPINVSKRGPNHRCLRHAQECPDTEVLPARAPMACEFNRSRTAGGPGQLDHWERIDLKRILDGQGGRLNPMGTLLLRVTRVWE